MRLLPVVLLSLLETPAAFHAGFQCVPAGQRRTAVSSRPPHTMSLNQDFISYGPALIPFALLWQTSHTVRQWHSANSCASTEPQSLADAGKARAQDKVRYKNSKSITRSFYLSPLWAIITGLTCNFADAQAAREFITAWLGSRQSLHPYSLDPYALDGYSSLQPWPAGTRSLQGHPFAPLEPQDSILNDQLRLRAKAVDEGAGRLFRVRTQVGFLNVHSEPDDAFRTDNIVAQCMEGQIVQSTGKASGEWVQHSAGGWSIRKYGDFVWLEPIDS